MLRVDPFLPGPVCAPGVEQGVRRRDEGTRPAGHRLPTVRQLAAELGLAPNTVARAYRELESRGVIETRGRHGSFVASTAATARTAGAHAARAYVSAVRALGLGDDDALALVREGLAPDATS